MAPVRELGHIIVQSARGLVRVGGKQVTEDLLSESEHAELYPEGGR